jgi:hypothetical protein
VTGQLVLFLALQVGAPGPAPGATFCMRVDSARHEAILTAGPFHVATHHHGHDEPPGEVFVQRFTWPVTLRVQGYRLRLTAPGGRPLPREWIHHLYIVDFSRRELVYPIAQRVLGLGRETPDITLPARVALPIAAGDELGVYLAWHGDAADTAGVLLEITFRWVVPREVPALLEVFPFFVDAHLALGRDWTFDIPPGGGSAAYEFKLPISGHLRVAGGHLHDHGVTLRLEDVATGAAVVVLRAQRDTSGRVLRIPYRVLARRDDGPHLLAGRRYRLVATYDNPTTRALPGVMGTLAGLFAPDDPRAWPRVDSADAAYALDRALLTTSHAGGGPQAAPGRVLADGRCGAEWP